MFSNSHMQLWIKYESINLHSVSQLILDQINQMASTDGEGPAWNKFWMSLENETESLMSGDGSNRPSAHPDGRSLMSPAHDRPGMHDRGDSVLPNDSASHHGADTPDHSAVAGAGPHSPTFEETLFPFKFKAPSGRMHRLQVVASAGISELVSQVEQKLGGEVETIGGTPEVTDGTVGKSGFALSYLDNEGDTVSITTDRDLLDAIELAHQGHRDKVDLFVHDPEKPPLSATVEPHPALPRQPSPPASTLRRRFNEEGEDEEEVVEKVRRNKAQPLTKQEELIAGVPNELLLPGAIVTLAVVIVAVFGLSRASSR
jgi:hypothetical protein